MSVTEMSHRSKAYQQIIDEAEAEAAKLRNFIRDLHEHGFIGSDKACRYRQGLEAALRRRENNA